MASSPAAYNIKQLHEILTTDSGKSAARLTPPPCRFGRPDARHRPIPIRRPLPKQISHETKHWRQFITFPDSKNKNKSSANFKTKFQFVKSKKLTLPLRLELHVQQSSHQLSATFSKCKLLFESAWQFPKASF